MHMTAADAPRRPDPLGTTDGAPDRVWYTAYGSNLHRDRLTCYLAGGRPPGARRSYPGCRDHSPPLATVPVLLPGQLYFALESKTWTGGMAFYDPFDEGELPARAYLLTAEQFADIAAQEMYRAPGTDLDLTGVLRTGRAQLGPGRYETLVCPGQLDGHPMLTFTAPWRRAEAELNRPSAAYLRNFVAGLGESHGWTRERTADYLSTRPGAAGEWTSAQILAALSEDV